MNTIVFLVMLGIGIWFWQDSLRSREIAIFYARQYCLSMNYQILDETVAVKKLKPGRNLLGNFAFYRHYGFEFSLNGYDRYNGNVFLIGQKPTSIQLNHPDGIIIHEIQN
ncbi:MAG: DUF3301 domain-containing protein [Pseudomonadota bacterium]|nr:DUF3301 domain-containing protein [Pseudomonadota bacterium]